MEPLIFHIDVNSAYLSWTSTENVRTGTGPDLRLLPAIIGGDQKNRHGVVLAKSIPAKAFGIVTGEPRWPRHSRSARHCRWPRRIIICTTPTASGL